MLYYVLHYLLLVNVLAAGFMAYDKLCAIKGRWRVPESTLFMLSTLGASPTVYVLIKYLRHKSRKGAFLRRFYAIVALQFCVASITAVAYFM